MGELGLNKIFGALLATILVALGLREISGIVFPSGDGHGGHHGEEHYESLNEKIAANFAYYVEVAESAGSDVVEEVFDLGAALASADIAAGERAFVGKCVTCHTIEQGGANGTGPNLYAMIGAEKHAKPGFSYSTAMTAQSGVWTYEDMNGWLENPSSYIRGTSMAFAGLRRDDERAAVIAYLASYTPNAPAFPEPLPEEEASEDGEESEAEPAAAEDAPAEEPVEAVVEEIAEPAPASEPAAETAEAAAEDAEAAGEAVTDAAEEAAETAEDAAAEVTETAEEAAASTTEAAEEMADDAAEAVEDAEAPEEE